MAKTLEEFENLVPDKVCKTCGGGLGPIEHYEHEGGWEVDGFDKRLWLYKPCLKCGYDWALWKIGVPRNA